MLEFVPNWPLSTWIVAGIVFFLFSFTSFLVQGFVYSEIWKWRGGRGAFTEIIDTAVCQSSVGTDIKRAVGAAELTKDMTGALGATFEGLEHRLMTAVKDIPGSIVIPEVVIPPIDFPTEALADALGKKLFNENRAQSASLARAGKKEQKQAMTDMAAVEAEVNFPNLVQLMANINPLIESGFISASGAEKFQSLMNIPQALPNLEKLATSINGKAGNVSAGSSKGAGLFK